MTFLYAFLGTTAIALLLCVVWFSSFQVKIAAIVSATTGFLLFGLGGFYLVDPGAFGTRFPFLAPFLVFTHPSAALDLLSQLASSLLLWLLAGGSLCFTAVRNLLTDAARKECERKARKELDEERERIQTKELAAEQKERSLLAKEQHLAECETRLQQSQNILNEQRAQYEQKRQMLVSEVAKYNSAIADKNNIENELRSQISILSKSNQTLKGLLGRIRPFEIAWKELGRQCRNAPLEQMMKTILVEAKIKAKERPVPTPKRAKRPEVPSAQPIVPQKEGN